MESDLDSVHAAGALWLYATAAPAQHNFALRCNKSVELTPDVRASCIALFAYCVEHGFFDFDQEETEDEAPHFFYNSFLKAAAAAEQDGGNALVEWENLGKLYNATLHTEACVATASYIAQLPNAVERVVQWQSPLPFPQISSNAEQNITNVELWLQTHFVQFHRKQYQVKQHMAKHITVLLHEQNLELRLAKLHAEQKRLAACVAAAQHRLESLQNKGSSDAPTYSQMLQVRKMQKRLLEDLYLASEEGSAADAPFVTSPKKQKQLTKMATNHLHKKLGKKFDASSMYTMYADPAAFANNAKALEAIHLEASKHANEPAALTTLPKERETFHINYRVRASAEEEKNN